MAKAAPKYIACRVREFKQEHEFGDHIAGDIVHVTAEDLKQPHIRQALITLDEEKREKEEAERILRESRKNRASTRESARQAAIAAQNERKRAAVRAGSRH